MLQRKFKKDQAKVEEGDVGVLKTLEERKR